MPDFMGMESGNNYPNTEHYLRRVLTGNVEDVRRRLNLVLERLDYDFIDEGELEIEARRNARGWATFYSSADVLDYPRTLLIKLKPVSENSTRASFAYTIKHPSLNRGEKAVLTREAETIVTLATIRATDKMCKVCGVEASDDSRFCRKCGAPMTGDETAIEVLRMTAEIRSGHTSVVTSSIGVGVMTLLTLVALILLTSSGVLVPKAVTLLMFSIAIGLINIAIIGFGWKRMNNALKSAQKETPAMADIAPQALEIREVAALKSAPAEFSVTDATTRTLNHPEKVPVINDRQRNTTNELN